MKHNLPSFAGLYDELIIADTGSDDRTVEIAEKAGAKVSHFKWIDDFSAARNFCLSRATSEYVMMIDADDFMTSTNRDELKRQLTFFLPTATGISLPYELTFTDTGRTTRSFLPRIWKRELGLKYIHRIHEMLDVPVELRPQFVKLDIPITQLKDAEIHKRSLTRNLEILEKVVQEEPDNQRYLYFLGHDHLFFGKPEEAIKHLKHYLKLKPAHSHNRNRAYFYLGVANLKLGNEQQAQANFAQAIETNSHFIEPYLYLGDLAQKQLNFEQAIEYYLLAVQNCKEPPQTHIFINREIYKNTAQRKIKEALENAKKQNN